jgi:DNA-binding NarL/FixJ family response regulator
MGIRVFLADDHTVIRDGLRLLLEAQADIEVVGEAADGRRTVRAVADVTPDVVVMDIAMPELNGIETARQLRVRCPAVKVIILSMYSSNEYIYQALQAGAMGFLVKESAGQEVIAAIRTVQAGRRYLSHRIEENVIVEYIRQTQSREPHSPLELLSDREREILQLVVEGKASTEIAKLLFLSPKTVETYRSRLMHKLQIKDLPSLVKFAIQHGLTSLE